MADWDWGKAWEGFQEAPMGMGLPYGLATGFGRMGTAGDKRRQATERARGRHGEIRGGLQEMADQARRGSQSYYDQALKGAGERISQVGRQQLARAAESGRLHSGITSATRQAGDQAALQSEQQISGQAAQMLAQALWQQQHGLAGLSRAESELDLLPYMQQMGMNQGMNQDIGNIMNLMMMFLRGGM